MDELALDHVPDYPGNARRRAGGSWAKGAGGRCIDTHARACSCVAQAWLCNTQLCGAGVAVRRQAVRRHTGRRANSAARPTPRRGPTVSAHLHVHGGSAKMRPTQHPCACCAQLRPGRASARAAARAAAASPSVPQRPPAFPHPSHLRPGRQRGWPRRFCSPPWRAPPPLVPLVAAAQPASSGQWGCSTTGQGSSRGEIGVRAHAARLAAPH